MARPLKYDADYFPFYAKDGRTLFILQQRYGLEGIGFFTNLMRLLTLTPKHHLCIQEEDDQLYFFSKIGIDDQRGMEMIEMMVKTKKIHKDLWEKHRVVASEDLINSLHPLYEKRKQDIITIEDIVSVYENRVSGPGNSVSDPVNTQSKAKQSKVKQSRAEETPDSPVDNSPQSKSSVSPSDVVAAAAFLNLQLRGEEARVAAERLEARGLDVGFINFTGEQLKADRSIKNPAGFLRRMLGDLDGYGDYIARYRERARASPIQRPGKTALPSEICPTCGGKVRIIGEEAWCSECRRLLWVYDSDFDIWSDPPEKKADASGW